MKKKKVSKLHLPKETLVYLGREEVGQAVGGAPTVLTCACTKVCTTNTARVGECCS